MVLSCQRVKRSYGGGVEDGGGKCSKGSLLEDAKYHASANPFFGTYSSFNTHSDFDAFDDPYERILTTHMQVLTEQQISSTFHPLLRLLVEANQL